MRRTPPAARSTVPAALAVLLVAVTASACTDDGPGDRLTDVVGDPSACAGRVSGRTLDAAFPGWDTTAGGFGREDGDVGGCTVRREGRRLASVAVTWEPSQAARRQALDRARDTTDPPPAPAGLGTDVAAGDDGVRGLSRLAIEQIIDSVYASDRPTISSGAEGQARLDADDVWQQTTAGVCDSVVGALFGQGYFSEGGRWADLAPSVMLDLSPDQVFVRADGSLVPPLEMTGDQHIAYTAWLNHDDSAVFANLLRDSVEPQFAAAASLYQS